MEINKWPKCIKAESIPIVCLNLLPKVDRAKEFNTIWHPGEHSAQAALKKILEHKVHQYHELRDKPSIEGTSRLSPHLHFGEISVRVVWRHVLDQIKTRDNLTYLMKPVVQEKGYVTFLKELCWREFAYHVLFHFPHTLEKPLKAQFGKMVWKKDTDSLHKWQKGMTGYPIVDAGMRQLWRTGWLYSRVRMIVASFLVKDLLIDWKEAERWFRDTLVDADLANNTLGWQWVAGCGVDVAPFFRIFNPVSQGLKFDPDGSYVRKWLPELKNLTGKEIHAP